MENYEVVTLRHSIFGVLRFDILFRIWLRLCRAKVLSVKSKTLKQRKKGTLWRNTENGRERVQQLSDVTTKSEYGVDREFIVKGIEAGKLGYRDVVRYGAIPISGFEEVGLEEIHYRGTWK